MKTSKQKRSAAIFAGMLCVMGNASAIRNRFQIKPRQFPRVRAIILNKKRKKRRILLQNMPFFHEISKKRV